MTGSASLSARTRTASNRLAAWPLSAPVCLCLAFAIPSACLGATDPHLEVTTLAGGFEQPIALQHARDGRLFVAERGGTIRTVDVGSGQTRLWARIDVVTDGECGLLGLALHPEFPDQPYVFVFASVSVTEQQILRLRDADGAGTEVLVIRDSIPTQGSNHNGGCVRIGPDGHLYFSVGDNGRPPTSQSLSSLTGKICRIRLDGTVPPDNPFSTPTGAPRSVYALGFRNPFRFCIAPDGRVFVMDVGSGDVNRREEINLVAPGDNCGWPLYEGVQPDAPAAGFVNPIYDYHDEGSSIAGCVIYDGHQFPVDYRGNLLHLDYTSHALFRAVLEGNRVVSHTLLVQAEGGPLDLTVLQDGTLAYCELFTGRVQRVRYTGPADEQVAGAPPVQTEESPVITAASPACGQGALAMMTLTGLILCGQRRSL